ncbi:MAG: peptidylprolyl isomerase [Planctomycetota bacterium]|nr:peptidylprolyl isomerase [Planctomycetota bacterium]
MKPLITSLLALGSLFAAVSTTAQDSPPPAPQVPPQEARLGVELAAIGPDCQLTFEELDGLLLARHGNSPVGQETLQGLAQLVLVEKLAEEAGIIASRAELNVKWRALEEQIISSGTAASLDEYLKQQGIKRKVFQRHLRLSILHEHLARAGLGLGPDDPLSGEQQSRWLEGVVGSLEQVKGEYPWDAGIVLTIGPHIISRQTFGEYLRGSVPNDQLRAACYELLLAERIAARLPDLAEDTIELAVTAEIDRRRKATESNTTFQGVAYEQLLQAQGLSLVTVRRDPAIRAAAMARIFVDRTHGDAELRAIYEEERTLFDTLYGEGHAISVLVLGAVRYANELNPRTYEAAESEIEAMKERIEGPKDFARLVGLHSDEPASKERKGFLGVITRGSHLVPETVREALWKHIDAESESSEGDLLGPFRLQAGVLLLQIGAHRPLPTWEEMSAHVHQELRRRLVNDALPTAAVSSWLDL